MNKILAILLITFGTTTYADPFTVVEREDQQIIKAQDEKYNYFIDVNCIVKLDADKVVDISTNKRKIEVGGKIKITQDNKKQSCKIEQLAITSVF